MLDSRRSFLKHLASVMSVLMVGTGLSGCLGEDDGSQASPATTRTAQSSSPPRPISADPTILAPPAGPPAAPPNSAPVWRAETTIEFVEGVPAVVSVRAFVQDPDADPLVITLKSGALLPGLTWNPTDYTIGYDGRPLGAKDDAPIVVTGLTFSADDGRP
jgi:hypothetical protein